MTSSSATAPKALSKIACNRLQKELLEWQVNPPVSFKHKVTDNLQRVGKLLWSLSFSRLFLNQYILKPRRKRNPICPSQAQLNLIFMFDDFSIHALCLKVNCCQRRSVRVIHGFGNLLV